MTKHKKPKTGDVVGWMVLDRENDYRGTWPYKSRDSARKHITFLQDCGDFYGPYRIAKIVLAR